MTKKLKRPVAFLSALIMVLAMLMYFPSGMFSTCFGLKASAAEITPTEPSTDTDGVYQIGTAEELYWFADKVNNDNGTYGSANAVLTANITVNQNVLNEKGELNTGNFISWTPIGWYDYINNNIVEYSYTGIFDGQGHTISGLYFNDTSFNCVGLFGYNSGTIKNVGVVDSYFSGNRYVGGVCGCNSYGTITNCYNTGTVSGTEEVGGVCGLNDCGTITNCYNTGKVSGTVDVGGVCGYNSEGTITNCYNTDMVNGGSTTVCVGGVCGISSLGTITNCYYLADTADKNGGKTTDQFNSGEVAYLLQGTQTEAVWGQTLTGTSKQDYPVLGGAKVYQLTKTYCDNTTEQGYVYANSTSCILHKEYNSNGFCANCGVYEPAIYSKTAKRYEISNAGQLYWFANYVNSGNTSANAVLTADITVNTRVLKSDGTPADDTSGFISWTPIGNNSNNYTGIFDGQGHTISGLYFNNDADYVGLFGEINGGTIKNVGVVDSYFNGTQYIGGVCGYKLFGTIENCYNTGTVSGSSYVGGVCGFNFDVGRTAKIINCYNTGTVSGSSYVGGVCGDIRAALGTIMLTNCYYLAGIAFDSNATFKTTDEFNSGEVAYLLSQGDNGSVWGQTLTGTSKQDYPVLGGAKVYQRTKTYCDGTTEQGYIYSNSSTYNILHKEYNNNGFCTTCGIYQSAVYNEIANRYEISNAGQLYWFADYVNSGNTNANAALTSDIIVNESVINANGELNTGSFKSWIPIGNTRSNTYTGTFNGRNNTISGLYFNNENTNYVGLFGCSQGTIKNVGIVDSYFKGQNSVGGVCGGNYSTITNCYYTGAVIGSSNVGGVCGANGSSSIITNCYNKGEVSGANYVGGVCGFNYSIIKNCYIASKVSGSDNNGGVCGGNEDTITNCYFDSDKYSGNAVGYNDCTVTNVNGKTTAQFKRGEVAYLLSQDTDGEVWGQTIGTDTYPVLGGTKVYTASICTGYSNTKNDTREHDYVNGICQWCGDIENDIMIYGQSATLDGMIGMNVYVAADDDYTDWTASFNGTVVEKPEKDENGLYKFTYQVAAKDMDNEIQFTVNDKIDVTVSVSGYLAALSETDNESLKNLVNSMSDYGNAAEAYFGSGTVAEQTVTDDLSGYAFTVGTMPEGISYYGSSLILESETTIRHYFKLAEGKNIADFTFKVNNSAVTPTEKQGYYFIDIENISAEKLGTSFAVSINGEEVITKYSALSYVNKVLDSGTANDNLKNLVKALYLYNKYALAYNAA